MDDPARGRDEWRVEVALDKEQHADSLSDGLNELQLDNEARKLLGGSVIVTRDGRFIFIYAWHEESAQEAEHVVKNLMQDEQLVGQVRLMRWHPVAEEWKDAEEPLPDDEAARLQEMHEAEHEGSEEAHRYGEYPWEVVIDPPHLRDGQALAKQLRGEGLPVKRHFRDAARRRVKRGRGGRARGAARAARRRRAAGSACAAILTTCPSPPSST